MLYPQRGSPTKYLLLVRQITCISVSYAETDCHSSINSVLDQEIFSEGGTFRRGYVTFERFYDFIVNIIESAHNITCEERTNSGNMVAIIVMFLSQGILILDSLGSSSAKFSEAQFQTLYFSSCLSKGQNFIWCLANIIYIFRPSHYNQPPWKRSHFEGLASVLVGSNPLIKANNMRA